MVRIYLRTSAIPELAPFDKRQRRMLELSALMTLEREHRIVGVLPVCLSVLGALLAWVGVSLIVHRGFPQDGNEMIQAVLFTMAAASVGAFLGNCLGRILLIPMFRRYVRRLVE
jgi:hypothetical protein